MAGTEWELSWLSVAGLDSFVATLTWGMGQSLCHRIWGGEHPFSSYLGAMLIITRSWGFQQFWPIPTCVFQLVDTNDDAPFFMGEIFSLVENTSFFWVHLVIFVYLCWLNSISVAQIRSRGSDVSSCRLSRYLGVCLKIWDHPCIKARCLLHHIPRKMRFWWCICHFLGKSWHIHLHSSLVNFHVFS